MTAAAGHGATAPIPVFLDCDTGIDDALALAYLLAEPRVRIVGIGTVSGNVRADTAAANTLALLDWAGRSDIPVAVGANDPLHGSFAGGAASVHGSDGLGEADLPIGAREPDPRRAVDLLAAAADTWAGSLRVLAVGPLTNLAQLGREHPDAVAQVAQVVVMGGAFTRPGNVTPFAEANIHNDPEAADLTFAAPWPVTVLPLDITLRHALTAAESARLRAVPGLLPGRLDAILQRYLDAYEPFFGHRACALHDPLAAIVAARPEVVRGEEDPGGIAVVTSGSERGRTVCLPGSGSPAPRRIVSEIDGRAADLLLDTIRSHRWPT